MEKKESYIANFAPVPAGGLSEDAIKQAFIPFLRTFYKNRYEFKPETFEASLDNVSGRGLVADGMLRFVQADGKVFICTYEASSRDKSGEVKFQLNLAYFVWDCMAFGAFFALAIYGILFYQRLPWLANLQMVGNIGMLLGFFTIGFFIWYYPMRHWRKYRYIYAIEQFKAYFADDQWVALGADVFPAPNDPYLVELKQQCVFNGFGLALVHNDGSVRILASPSRMGIYGRDRRMAHWITRNEWYVTVSKNLTVITQNGPQMPGPVRAGWNRVNRSFAYNIGLPTKQFFWNFFKEQLDDSNTSFSRYMHGRSMQKWVLGLCVLISGLLCYQVLQYSTENYIDPETLLERKAGPNPEDQPGYILDADPVPYATPPERGVPKQYPQPVPEKQPEKNLDEKDEDIQVINLSGE